VSNDHDGVMDDGQEPDAVPSDDGAQESVTDTGSRSTVSTPAGADEVADRGRAASTLSLPDTDSDDDVEESSAAPPTPTGPVSAGSARAAARRTAARAGISEAKGAPTAKRAASTTVKKPNVFARFGRFLREVVAELRKVIWPTKNQMITYTIVVIVFVAFMVALVGVLDLLFAKGVLAVFG
jgi:preprotein translocase subunit SecE